MVVRDRQAASIALHAVQLQCITHLQDRGVADGMHDVDACRQAWEHVAPQPVQDSQAAMRDFARLHGHLAERVTTLRAWVG